MMLVLGSAVQWAGCCRAQNTVENRLFKALEIERFIIRKIHVIFKHRMNTPACSLQNRFSD